MSGCLSAHIERRGSLEASAYRHGDVGVSCVAERTDTLNASCQLLVTDVQKARLKADVWYLSSLDARCSRLGVLKVDVSCVCGTGISPYLMVKPPEDVQWLSEFDDYMYDVLSNVEWIVFSKNNN